LKLLKKCKDIMVECGFAKLRSLLYFVFWYVAKSFCDDSKTVVLMEIVCGWVENERK